jgi:hypothetical protein
VKRLPKALLIAGLLVGALSAGIKYGQAQYSREEGLTYLPHPADTTEITGIELADLGGPKLIAVTSKDAQGRLQMAFYDLSGQLKSVYVPTIKREGRPEFKDWKAIYAPPKATKFDLTPLGETPKDEAKAGGKADAKAPAKAPADGKADAKAQ